jgi:hypothetical protein
MGPYQSKQGVFVKIFSFGYVIKLSPTAFGFNPKEQQQFKK